MKKLFVILSFLISLMFISSQSWGLPDCPKTGDWNNCYGSYTDQDGDEYLGEWKDNQFNGKGAWTSADGGKYSGQFKDGTMHGQGTLISAQRDKYVGKFKNGKKHGKGSYSWINGDKYLGEYKDNNEHGKGTFTWENNGDKYIGEWKNGYANGQGTMFFGDGDKYLGEWKDSQFNGQGTFTYADGRIEEGIFKDNKFTYAQKIKKQKRSMSNKLYTNEFKEIVLIDGANKFQSEAISSGLSNLILEDAKSQLTKSHFPYGPHCKKNILDCRHNFNFTAQFKTASSDLNFDGFSEVFVNYISRSYCGSGGCKTYILEKNINNNWIIIGQFLP